MPRHNPRPPCPPNTQTNPPTGPTGGTPQYPLMFSPYSIRPSWQVPGCDFYVGVPSGTTLTPWYSPAAFTGLPVSANTSNGQIGITGSCTITGIDFDATNPTSGAAGSIVSISTTGLTVDVRTCRIGKSPLLTYWSWYVSCATCNLSFTECLFSGGTTDQSAFLAFGATGSLTLTYCEFTRGNQHVIEAGDSGKTVTYRFENNLVHYMNIGAGQHFNAIQWAPGTIVPSPTIRYNAYYANGTGNGELFQWMDSLGANLPTLSNPTCSRNVCIVRGGASLMGNAIHGGLCTTGVVSENYFDMTGAVGGAFYTGTMTAAKGWAASGNTDLLTGATITPS